MQDSGLICPNCNGHLKEAFAEANYGRVLLLDQCERCGGVGAITGSFISLKRLRRNALIQ